MTEEQIQFIVEQDIREDYKILRQTNGYERLLASKEYSKELTLGQTISEGIDFEREYFHSDYCFAVKKSKNIVT
jgi:hypothetical protein